MAVPRQKSRKTKSRTRNASTCRFADGEGCMSGGDWEHRQPQLDSEQPGGQDGGEYGTDTTCVARAVVQVLRRAFHVELSVSPQAAMKSPSWTPPSTAHCQDRGRLGHSGQARLTLLSARSRTSRAHSKPAQPLQPLEHTHSRHPRVQTTHHKERPGFQQASVGLCSRRPLAHTGHQRDAG